jgi:hypothetical protein
MDDGVADADIGGAAADVLLRVHRCEHTHVVDASAFGLLDHHDRIGALRQRGARRDLHRFTRPDGRARHLARMNGPDDAQRLRLVAPRAERVFGADGVSVHRGAIEWRHVERGRHGRSRDPIPRLSKGNPFGPLDRRRALEHDRARVLERNRFADRPH